MSTRVFDLSNLPGVGQFVRRYAQTGLRGDIAAIGITAVACFAAVVWPTIAYLLLLTAVAANICRLGALRALVISLAVIALLFAFVIPTSDKTLLAQVFKDVPHVVFFFLIVGLVSAATEVLRRPRAAADNHVLEVNSLNGNLALLREQVRDLADDLTTAKEELEDAMVEAERTRA